MLQWKFCFRRRNILRSSSGLHSFLKSNLSISINISKKTENFNFFSFRNDKGLSGNFEYDGNDYAQSDEDGSE